jgi:hypothetical protein
MPVKELSREVERIEKEAKAKCDKARVGEISCEGKIILCETGKGRDAPQEISIDKNYVKGGICPATEFHKRTDGNYNIHITLGNIDGCSYCDSNKGLKV